MTFASGKWRTNNTTINNNYTIIKPGELVDPNYEVDVMFLVYSEEYYPSWYLDNYTLSIVNPLVRTIASSVLTAWPMARMGLSKWTNTNNGTNPYTEIHTLQAVTQNDIDGWTVTNTSSGSYYSSDFNALKKGCESGSFGWRSVVPGRKRFIVVLSYLYGTEPSNPSGYPNITSDQAVEACINNNIWPIWSKVGGISSSSEKKLTYGKSIQDFPGFYYYSNSYYSTYRKHYLVLPEILGGIYDGIVN